MLTNAFLLPLLFTISLAKLIVLPNNSYFPSFLSSSFFLYLFFPLFIFPLLPPPPPPLHLPTSISSTDTFNSANFQEIDYGTKTFCGKICPLQVQNNCLLSPSPCLTSPLPAFANQTIFFFDWTSAKNDGCSSYKEVIDQILTEIGGNPLWEGSSARVQPHFLIGSEYSNLIGSTIEKYGDLDYSLVSGYFVSVSRIASSFLLKQEPSPDVCVTLGFFLSFFLPFPLCFPSDFIFTDASIFTERGWFSTKYESPSYMARMVLLGTWFSLILLFGCFGIFFDVKDRKWWRLSIVSGVVFFSLCKSSFFFFFFLVSGVRLLFLHSHSHSFSSIVITCSYSSSDRVCCGPEKLSG